METKLTLSIEKRIIDHAKKYASEKGKSLSEIVSEYFKILPELSSENQTRLQSKRVRKLRGIVKVGEDFDYKKILNEERDRKHAG